MPLLFYVFATGADFAGYADDAAIDVFIDIVHWCSFQPKRAYDDFRHDGMPFRRQPPRRRRLRRTYTGEP